MSKTNCINCGAAKDTDEIKCPFCGTTYLDFTAIDFSSEEPVVCQFVLPNTNPRAILSMVAIPRLNSVTTEYETVSAYGAFSTVPIAQVCTGFNVNIGVEFIPVARRSDNALLSIKVEQ